MGYIGSLWAAVVGALVALFVSFLLVASWNSIARDGLKAHFWDDGTLWIIEFLCVSLSMSFIIWAAHSVGFLDGEKKGDTAGFKRAQDELSPKSSTTTIRIKKKKGVRVA